MMNFTAIIYSAIGNRIKEIIRSEKCTMDEFARKHNLDRTTLSHIINGRAVKARNPYFINEIQIGDMLNITPGNSEKARELVWGNDTERQELVKLMVLAVLMYVQNPFYGGENPDSVPDDEVLLEEWLNARITQGYADTHELEEMKHHIADTKEKYGYFFSSKRHRAYDVMTGTVNLSYKEAEKQFKIINELYEKLSSSKEAGEEIERLEKKYSPPAHSYSSYDEISNLILKQTLQYYNLAHLCYDKILNADYDKSETNLENFLLNKRSYNFCLPGTKDVHYLDFIQAFERFWKRVQPDYMSFFNKNLFYSDQPCCGLRLNKRTTANPKKDLNVLIHNLFVSDEFRKINEQSLLLEEYTNGNAIFASLEMRLSTIEKITLDNLFLHSGRDDSFNKYILELSRTVTEYAKQYIRGLEENKESKENIYGYKLYTDDDGFVSF